MNEDLSVKPLEPPDKNVRPETLTSRDLLAGYREVLIEHGGEHYRLRLTNNNKLILVK